MSHEIPVFYFSVDASLTHGIDSEQALSLAPDKPMLWMATSRNWWYQNLIEQVLEVFPGTPELSYLVNELALVQAKDTATYAAMIRQLLGAIHAEPDSFEKVSRAGETAAVIRRQIEEAYISREFDDDSTLACSNFFTFLLSQAAALEEASRAGKALLYVQPQPTPSAVRLP
jgi:hypothetical protein